MRSACNSVKYPLQAWRMSWHIFVQRGIKLSLRPGRRSSGMTLNLGHLMTLRDLQFETGKHECGKYKKTNDAPPGHPLQ